MNPVNVKVNSRQEGKTALQSLQCKLNTFENELRYVVKADSAGADLMYYVTNGVSTVGLEYGKGEKVFTLDTRAGIRVRLFNIIEAREVSKQFNERGKGGFRPMERKEWLRDQIDKVSTVLKSHGLL